MTNRDLTNRRNRLLGIETPAMRGDCLGVCLASFFEPQIESEELDDSGTWKQGAIDAANEVADAIHAHYAARIEELEALAELNEMMAHDLASAPLIETICRKFPEIAAKWAAYKPALPIPGKGSGDNRISGNAAASNSERGAA